MWKLKCFFNVFYRFNAEMNYNVNNVIKLLIVNKYLIFRIHFCKSHQKRNHNRSNLREFNTYLI